MKRIGTGGRPRNGGGRVFHQPFQQRHRPRRCRHRLARLRTQPQPELQHVEGLFRAPPFAQFIEPRGIELRPAQTVGIFRRKSLRDGAIGPFQPAAGRLPDRPFVAPVHRQQARHAFDHHIAHIGLGFPHQGNASGRTVGKGRQAERHAAHPFRACPRFSCSAPAQHQPDRPRQSGLRHTRRALVGPRPAHPVGQHEFDLAFAQRGNDPFFLTGLRAIQQDVEPVPRACFRGRWPVRRQGHLEPSPSSAPLRHPHQGLPDHAGF